MKTSLYHQTSTAPLNWRRILILVISHLLLWLCLDALGALARFGDLEQQGKPAAFLPLWLNWLESSAGYLILSSGLHLLFSLRPNLLQSRRALILLYLAVLLVYLPLELVYCAALNLLETQPYLNASGLLQAYQALRKSHWFTDGVVMSAVYFAIVSLQIWRNQRQRELRLQKTQTDNLNLQLQLEQSRLHNLQAQLEPHFIFNALNAIAALVRSDDKRLALSAINQLSHLLRYALQVMQQQQVSLQQELAFCHDYLSLQQLRYGERLQLQFARLTTDMQNWPCPPLILQPLLENALRHDLDKHQHTSTITLDAEFISREADRFLRLQLRNPIASELPGNPGLGLGLNQVRQQLQHVYAGNARLDIQETVREFIVTLELPEHTALGA